MSLRDGCEFDDLLGVAHENHLAGICHYCYHKSIGSRDYSIVAVLGAAGLAVGMALGGTLPKLFRQP